MLHIFRIIIAKEWQSKVYLFICVSENWELPRPPPPISGNYTYSDNRTILMKSDKISLRALVNDWHITCTRLLKFTKPNNHRTTDG